MISYLLKYSLMFFTSSIYSFQINSSAANKIDFNDFRGKKMLLINIASGSEYVGQLEQLEQLHQLYKDSLIIIAFPSNSFGNEPMNNMEIDNFCRANYHTNFMIAEKNEVVSDGVQLVYNWLALKSENGICDTRVADDFQKFLIDNNGMLKGIFSPSVNPMSYELKRYIDN